MSDQQSKPLRIAVGMSGGVDSSAAAARLVDDGHEVVGFTAHLWAEGSRCCSLDDAIRARHIAHFLGFEHFVIDAVDFFKERIVEEFVEEYTRGRTPSPCVLCNQVVKFGLLLRDAVELGCTHVATGHYARLERREDGWHLLRGADRQKDQSYFLHRLNQSQLEHILLPLGEWTKEETRSYASERGLPLVSGAHESQDLCFVTDDGYVAFIEGRHPGLGREGPIVDTSGNELGRHNGFHHFTVGQREGIGVASDKRLYVTEVRPDTNTVVVGSREETERDRCSVRDPHWILGKAPSEGSEFLVQLRYRHPGVKATVHFVDEGTVEARFSEPQFGVAPGQAAVFYDGDEVVGGGWIEGNG